MKIATTHLVYSKGGLYRSIGKGSMISVYKTESSYVTIRKHRGAPAPGAPMVPTPMTKLPGNTKLPNHLPTPRFVENKVLLAFLWHFQDVHFADHHFLMRALDG